MAGPHGPNPPAESSGLEEWRRLAEKALGGRGVSTLESRTRDGLCVRPLYIGRPYSEPLPARRAPRWDIVQIVDDPNPEHANRQLLQDLQGGASGVSLRFTGAASVADRGLPLTEEALRVTLEGVDIAAIGIGIDPHVRAREIGGWLRELVARQGVAPELTRIAWGLDPALLAASGGGSDPARVAQHFADLRDAGFGGPLAEVDTRPYHEAGGSEAQELGSLLAGTAWWLRLLDGAGVPPAEALPYFGAFLAVDRDQFLSIGKLRAARLLWARLAELCGVPGAHLRIHAETSCRMMTRSDPHSNLLRTAIAAFAAGVGGADSLTVLPFTAALGLADANARALARNMQHLLMEESHLHRTADPGAGSGLVEGLTDDLAEAGWSEFQRIEGEGGLLASLRAGSFQARIAAACEALRAELAGGAFPLVGATVFCPDDPDKLASEVPAPGPEPVHGLPPVRLETLARQAA